MTTQELKNIRYYKAEIKAIQEHIRELERQAEYTSNVLSGMPAAKGKRDRMSEAIAASIDEQERLKQYILKLQEKQAKAMQFIENIDDSMLRTAFICRYIHGYSWAKTAMQIGGGNNEDCVYKQVKRYLEKHAED